MTRAQAMAEWAKAELACRVHALSCRSCFIPIIDAEGNPGYFSEACREGNILLRVYVAAEKLLLESMKPRSMRG